MKSIFKLQDIGIKDDLGYETFLHGSQTEIRRVFIILIQMLPKANEQPIPEKTGMLTSWIMVTYHSKQFCLSASTDPFQNVLGEIRKDMQIQLNRPWVPSFCHSHKEKCENFHPIDISHQMCQSGNNLSSCHFFFSSIQLDFKCMYKFRLWCLHKNIYSSCYHSNFILDRKAFQWLGIRKIYFWSNWSTSCIG